MRKFVVAGAFALVLSVTTASAQSALDKGEAYSTHARRPGSATVAQKTHTRRDSAPNANTHSAFSRNVGPGSSVAGSAESELGSAASGNDKNPHAPAAGGLGSGGQ